MSYEFKVGDKGKLRNGKLTYEVIAVVPDMISPVIAKKFNEEGKLLEDIAQRRADGQLYATVESALDFMPPTKIVYDVYYEYGVGWSTNGHVSSTLTFDNIEQAKKTYDKYNNNANAFKNVKLTPREVQPE